MRGELTDNPVLRVAICAAAAIAVLIVLLLLPVPPDRLLAAGLNLFLVVVLVVSIRWGTRYAILASVLSALAFSWSIPPAGHIPLRDARVLTLLTACLVTGVVAAQLSARVRRAVLEANQRRVEAETGQQRFTDLVNSVGGVVWEADAKTFAFTFVSDQAERVLGYPTEKWLQEPAFWKDHLHPDDRDWAVQLCSQATVEKRSHDFEYRMVAADGRVVWMRDLVTVVVEDGRATRLRGVMVDISRRKQMEQALRESESSLAEAQRLTHTGSFIWDIRTQKPLYLSDEWYRVYGFDAERDQADMTAAAEVEGLVPRALFESRAWDERLKRIPPEDRSQWQAAVEQAITKRSEYESEYRVVLPSGVVKYVHAIGHPICDSGGEVAQFAGSVTDITQRKRAESLLAGEKRILEMVARDDPLPEILDNLCRLVEEQAIGALASILLLDGNRLRHGGAPSLPKAYTEAIDGGAIGPVAGSCGTAAYRGQPVIVEDIATDPLWAEYRDLALPHSLRACWSAPVLSSQGKVMATFAMYYREPRRPSQDDKEIIEQITHLVGLAIGRKLTQERLQRNEAYLAESQTLTHTGSWAWSPAPNKTLYWSEEMFRIWGFDPQHGVPAADMVWQRIHPDDLARVRQALEEAYHRNAKVDLELDHRIVLPDGTVKHLHETAHPVSNRAGQVVEYIGSSVDITELKQAEQERERLHQLEAELARINQVTTMGELTASLAHEINQPIAAAVTNANTSVRWLDNQVPNIEEAREAAKRAAKDATRAAEIINRIRSLFRKGASQRELVNLNQVIDEMVALLLRTEADRHGVTIRSELASDLPEVMADRVQLQQVVLNLMINGIEAMRGVDHSRLLTLSSQRNGGSQLLVSVSDTGAGLPPDMGKMFDAFFTTKPDGTGMGLAISRTIVESHGGRLWATANSGSGSTFHFTLPITV